MVLCSVSLTTEVRPWRQTKRGSRGVVGPVGSTLQIQYYTESAVSLSRSKDDEQVVTIGLWSCWTESQHEISRRYHAILRMGNIHTYRDGTTLFVDKKKFRPGIQIMMLHILLIIKVVLIIMMTMLMLMTMTIMTIPILTVYCSSIPVQWCTHRPSPSCSSCPRLFSDVPIEWWCDSFIRTVTNNTSWYQYVPIPYCCCCYCYCFCCRWWWWWW